MRSNSIETHAKEIVRWSEPLVADYIHGQYERLLGGSSDITEALGRQHCRMWRDLLNGEGRRAQLARRDLLKLAQLAKLGEASLDAIDASIFDALFDVILRRSTGSRDTARIDGHALVQAASTLGEIRHAA